MPIRSTLVTLAVLAALAQAQTVSPKVLERYKQMLVTNPVEGIALERLWKAALEAGKTDGLIADYEGRNDFSARMVLGHLQRRAGKDDKAEQAFRKALELERTSPLPALALAQLESDRGHSREAAEWLEKAAAALPAADARLADTLLKLGGAWQSAGETGKAAEAWERVVTLDPQNLELRRKLATAYADNFLTAPALRHLEYVAERGPAAERAAAWQEIGKLQSRAGQPGKAREALERAVSLTAPGNWLRSELLGQIVRMAQRQRDEPALEAKWKAEAEANPRDLGAALQVLEFYERTGALEQQVGWLEKITALVPRNGDYRLRLARVLVQLDRLEAGAAQLDQLLQEQPGNVDLVFERAQLDVQREDPAAARKRIGAVLERNSADDSLRTKALEFYQQHRLFDLVEEHLKADAAANAEEPLLKLANFYFAQRRKTEAQAVLARLIREGDPADRRAALHFRVAQILRTQSEYGSALETLKKALEFQPKHREFQMLRGELEMALRDYEAARVAFAEAFALSGNDAERQEADAKLFETFRAETPSIETENPLRRQGGSMAARVEGFIRQLMKEASERKDAESWLRVARWKALNSDRASAVTFAAKAAEITPKDPAPKEFIARLASSHGDVAMALAYLRELVELNPANRALYLREIAQLELQRGEVREALGLFEELVKSNPGNADALADLATAQERGNELEAALATWRKVVSAIAPHRKREAGTSLLRVLQGLNRHQEAAEWLLRGVDETRDEQERGPRFDELLLHARQHELLGWLRAKFEDRRKQRADDYFTAVALGRIRKLSGDKAGAFELFADAVFSAPEQGEALPELVREAEDLRRFDVAVRLQEQVLRRATEDQPDDFFKLAALYHKTGDLEGTEQTWSRAVTKFPRDAEVVRRAAEFHQQWGDAGRSAAWLRKLATLEPSEVRTAIEWGEVEFAAGHMEEAKLAYESVMRLTKPVLHRLYPARDLGCPWGERGAFAGTGRATRGLSESVMLAAPWRSVPENTTLLPSVEHELRLKALARLATIAVRQGSEARERWIAEWTPLMETQATDAIWALYFAEAKAMVWRELVQRMKRDAQIEGHRQAFIWMTLESGAVDELREWLNAEGRSAKDLEWFTQAFGMWVQVHPERVDGALLDGLFPQGNSVRLWASALELARQHRFPEALRLGGRYWEKLADQRVYVGREMARWHLALGQVDEAKRLLRTVAQADGESLDAPPFVAAWELCQMLSQEERTVFLDARLAAAGGDSTAALLWRFVGQVFAGRDERALAHLDELIARRPLGPPGGDETNSVTRFWAFMNVAHRQLVAWGRADLASHLWQRMFADPGLLGMWRAQKVREQVEGATGLAADLWTQKRTTGDEERRGREQMELLEFLRGGDVERMSLLAEYQARGGSALVRLGDALESQGAHRHAALAFRRAWEHDLGNAGLLRKAVDSARQAGDAVMSEAIRRRCLEEKMNPGNDTTPREFALELADLLEQRGAVAEAVEVLARELKREPEFRVLSKYGQMLERAGRVEEAEQIWQRLIAMDGGNAYSRNALAVRLETRGRFEEALAVRTRVGSAGDPQATVLLDKLGRSDEAVASLEKLGGAQAVYAAMSLAESMGLRGEGKLARGVLVGMAGRMVEPREQMQLRTKLLTIPGDPPSALLVSRTQAKLRTLARQNAELEQAYFDFFETYAKRLGIEEAWNAEVRETWANGKGAVAAGAALARRQMSKGEVEPAKETVKKLLARADTTGGTLSRLASQAQATGQKAIQLRLAEDGARRSWPFAEGMIHWVQMLDGQGHREKARETLALYDWLAAYAGGMELLAEAWLRLGDGERARRFYQMAWKQDALALSSSEVAGMARVQLTAGRQEAARILLRRAFADPGCREYASLVDYLAGATNQLGRWREAVREFGLSGAREHEFAGALFGYFEKAGRGKEALHVVAETPTLVVPSQDSMRETPSAEEITSGRLRALARKTGGFAETAKVLDQIAAAGVAEARAERAALEADRVASINEPAGVYWKEAFVLVPANWEYARNLAEAQVAEGKTKAARGTLERFLSVSMNPREKAAALEAWEKVGK
jgi:tetratricopeptide (TPR) repeat protein